MRLATEQLLQRTTVEVFSPEPSKEVDERWTLRITTLGRELIHFECDQKPEWVRLVPANNWGSIFYRRELWNSYTADEAKTGIVLKDRVRVRWPNGSETEERVGTFRHHETVYDHGHRSEVSCQVPCLLVDNHGVGSQVKLDTVEIHRDSFEKLP